MPRNPVLQFLRHFRFEAGSAGENTPDHLLLERFVMTSDQSAFAALMARHGAMVLGVCRRILHDEHQAEDVLQATFLSLARNARSIRNRSSVGSWLHRVALRLGHKARARIVQANQAALANQVEQSAKHAVPSSRIQSSSQEAEASWREVRQILDEELERLPEHYRLPLILCYLEGQSRDEAAAQLGWTPGRLKGRLERGREQLRLRLIRRELTLSSAGTALLADAALSAAPVPSALVAATMDSALRLAAGASPADCGASATVHQLIEGGLTTMGSKKIALVFALTLITGAVGLGAGLLAQRIDEPAAPDVKRSSPAQPAASATDGESKAKDRAKTDQEKIQGAWQFVSSEYNGKRSAADGTQSWIFKDDTVTIVLAMSSVVSKFSLDPAKEPKWLTLINNNGVQDVELPFIYKLEADVLTVCFDLDGKGVKQRPREFTGNAGLMLRVFHRAAQARTVSVWREKAAFEYHSNRGQGGGGGGRRPLTRILPGALQFSPDGDSVQAMSTPSDFELFDLLTGNVTEVSQGEFLGFGPDGTAWNLISGCAIIDVRTGKERSRIVGAWQAVLSPDAKTLASTNFKGEIKLWDAETGKELGALNDTQLSDYALLAFSPDSKTLATVGSPPIVYGDQGVEYTSIKLWDVATRKELASRMVTSKVRTPHKRSETLKLVRFSPDGRRLAIACSDRMPDESFATTGLRLWDVAGLKESGKFHSEEFGNLRDFAFSPDGKTVGLVWEQWVDVFAPVTILELATGNEIGRIQAESFAVALNGPPERRYAAVAFSPDGKMLATENDGGIVKVWEACRREPAPAAK
jgi:RNA polymerase sigma factor (sigma-70 family)